MEWKIREEPHTKKARISKLKVKTFLIAFFTCSEFIIEEWVPTGQTVNLICNLEVMCKSYEWICKKRPELWKNGFVIHHDDVPSQTAYIACDLLPRFGPSNVFLFPKLKEVMNSHQLETILEIKAELSRVLMEIPAEDY